MTWIIAGSVTLLILLILIVLSCCWVSGNAAQREEDELGVRRS